MIVGTYWKLYLQQADWARYREAKSMWWCIGRVESKFISSFVVYMETPHGWEAFWLLTSLKCFIINLLIPNLCIFLSFFLLLLLLSFTSVSSGFLIYLFIYFSLRSVLALFSFFLSLFFFFFPSSSFFHFNLFWVSSFFFFFYWFDLFWVFFF